jgi:FAD:protein FMN transferase
MPVRHELASVTVVADTTTEADALDTALMVMGPERALAFAEEQKLAVLLLVKDENGKVEERFSSAFKPYLKEYN